MIVSDFVKWLQTQDQEATIEVLRTEYKIFSSLMELKVLRVEFDLNHVVYSKRNKTLFLGKN